MEKNFKGRKPSTDGAYGIRDTKGDAVCYWCFFARPDKIALHERRRDALKELMVVFDRDEIYAERLAASLNRQAECPFEVRTVADREDLKRLAREGRIAILLLGDDAEEQNFDRSLAGRTVHLSAVREETGPGGKAQVFKYQSVPGLLRSLRAMTGDAGAQERTTDNGKVLKQGFIGVASPVGRCGKTAFSMTLARLLGEEKKVLSIDLETTSVLFGLYGRDFRHSFSDLLYAERVGMFAWQEEHARRNGPEETSGGSAAASPGETAVSDFIVRQWGLDLAPPPDSPETIFDTSPQEIVRAAEHLYAASSYEAAVLDLGSGYGLIRAFLPKLGKLYVPTLRDEASRVKTEEFLRWVRKNTLKRELPVETVYVPAVPLPASGTDPVEPLLFSETGDLVRKMLSGEARGGGSDGYGQK